MTSNQRRPGFRLPWSSEEEAAAAAAAAQAEANGTALSAVSPPEPARAEDSEFEAPAASPPRAPRRRRPRRGLHPRRSWPGAAAADVAVATGASSPPAPFEAAPGLMADLVAAMRGVADEARRSNLAELRTKSEERVTALEAESEGRRAELHVRADTDVAEVGEWATAEHERVNREAEQKVAGRRAELDQQLAAETSRAEADAQALRDRVTAYEKDLDAYHAQLSNIADPAAFAAAAKRMPAAPELHRATADNTPAADAMRTNEPVVEAEPEPEQVASTDVEAPAQPGAEDALAARLAELDAQLEGGTSATEAPGTDAAAPPRGETAATEVMVKGLGSFGAITGFRQALAGIDGIDGVSLSLGPTGEFVFRAIHAAGFDVAGAIQTLEGDAATIEELPEGGLRVSLERSR